MKFISLPACAILLAATLVSGCATGLDHYDRANTSRSAFQNDYASCQSVAMEIPLQHSQADVWSERTTGYRGDPLDTEMDARINQDSTRQVVRGCMQAKGYVRRPDGDEEVFAQSAAR